MIKKNSKILCPNCQGIAFKSMTRINYGERFTTYNLVKGDDSLVNNGDSMACHLCSSQRVRDIIQNHDEWDQPEYYLTQKIHYSKDKCSVNSIYHTKLTSIKSEVTCKNCINRFS